MRFPWTLALAASLVVGCGSADPNVEDLVISSEEALRTAWSFDTNAWIQTRPAFANDGTLYVGTSSNFVRKVFAISSTGTLKWTYASPSYVHSAPVVGSDGTIFIGVGTSMVALSASGSAKWSHDLGGEIWCATIIAPDGSLLCNVKKKIFALSQTTGAEKWSLDLGQQLYGTLTVAPDGTIYTTGAPANNNERPKVFAVSSNGSLKWTHEVATVPTLLDVPVRAVSLTDTAVGTDGTLYVGAELMTNGKALLALTPNGVRKWWVGVDAVKQPVLGPDGTIYVAGMRANGLHALTAVKPGGTVAWTQSLGHGAGTPYVAANNEVWIGALPSTSSEWELVVFSPQGTRLRALSMGSDRVYSPLAKSPSGRICFGTQSHAWPTPALGRVVCVDP